MAGRGPAAPDFSAHPLRRKLLQPVVSRLGILMMSTMKNGFLRVAALALSLHTTRADLREQLLPRAPRLSPQALVAAAEHYARSTGYPVQYQWTLLEGINDSDEEIEGLTRLLSGTYGVLNLIPYNSTEGGEG